MFPIANPLEPIPGIAGISSENVSVIPPEVAVKLSLSGIVPIPYPASILK